MPSQEPLRPPYRLSPPPPPFSSARRREPSRDPAPAAPPGRPARRVLPPGTPPLRLVDADLDGPARGPAATEPTGQPIATPADPRWIVAMRAAESLEGTILRPEKRELLILLGKRLGLSGFDANLILAIVQDQARRGYAPEFCPTAAEPQLRMIALPRAAKVATAVRRPRAVHFAGFIAGLLALELLVLLWLMA